MPGTAEVVRAPYRPYQARVVRTARLSPHFVRVTFTGDELEHFGTAGLDQRIKVMLPHEDGTFTDVGQSEGAGDWYDRWRALPTGTRNLFRTYTVRRVAPVDGEVDIDFVVHPGAGPAGAWAEAASVGQELVIVGPDERSSFSRGGIDWHPGTARRVLLAGDETAAPAMASILESLGDEYDVDAFIEVPLAADVLEIAGTHPRSVTWIARDGAAHGTKLIDAVRRWVGASADLVARAAAPRRQVVADVDIDRELLWDSPGEGDGEFYAWMAGEAATVKTLRRLLVTENGIDRKRVAFMGYWRLGQSERIG